MTIHRLFPLAAPLFAGAVLLVAAGPVAAADGHSWERFASEHDENGDGTVTRDEIARTSRLFEHMDANADGVLTADDFAERRAGHLLAHVARRADADDDGALTHAELAAWFAERDTDGNGVLDAADHASADRADKAPPARGRRGQGGPRAGGPDGEGERALPLAELDALFAEHDADGDGILAGDELPAAHRGHHRRGPHGGGHDGR